MESRHLTTPPCSVSGGSASGRRGSTHPQVLRNTSDAAFDQADRRRRGPQFGIGDQRGVDERDDSPACFERARLGGKDVFHPLHVRPVGQEEVVLLTSSEHIHRRVKATSTLPASMRQDAEAWEPACDAARDRIDVARRNMPETPHAGAAADFCVASVHAVTTSSPTARRAFGARPDDQCRAFELPPSGRSDRRTSPFHLTDSPCRRWPCRWDSVERHAILDHLDHLTRRQRTCRTQRTMTARNRPGSRASGAVNGIRRSLT
jgi:hypothetical protein